MLDVRSRKYDWDIAEHLHTDLIQVFFFTSGNGVVLSESRRIRLNPPSVLLIPANTLHGFAFEPNMKGEVLTITEESLEMAFTPTPHLVLELNRLQHFTFAEQPEAFANLSQIWETICRELTTDQPERDMSLRLTIQLLWIQLYRVSLESAVRVQPSDNRTLQYFQGFQKSIRQSVHQVKSVQEYAHELNITPVHLNRICRSLVDKSASQVVHDYLIAEAKKYLQYTTYSLSEISWRLNFRDPSYFSRFFRKHTGQSPKAFRQKGGVEQPNADAIAPDHTESACRRG